MKDSPIFNTRTRPGAHPTLSQLAVDSDSSDTTFHQAHGYLPKCTVPSPFG